MELHSISLLSVFPRAWAKRPDLLPFLLLYRGGENGTAPAVHLVLLPRFLLVWLQATAASERQIRLIKACISGVTYRFLFISMEFTLIAAAYAFEQAIHARRAPKF